jgi:glycosyltransferase involved in cell wall biosynthesis
MKASVIIIDYKRKKYILDALKSIKNQKGIDLNDIEVIVVKYYQDEKIDNYIKENFPNYKIINLDPNDPDHYVGRNYSEGIKASSSNLIFLLDDDDMFVENKMSRIFEVVEKIKNYDEYMIIHRLIPIDENGNIIKENKSIIRKILDRISYITPLNNSCIILYIKDKNNLVDYLMNIRFSVDVALIYYFKAKGAYIELDKKLTYNRRHSENTSSQFDKNKLEMLFNDYEYIYEKLGYLYILNFALSYKMQLNLLYKSNYKIKFRDYLFYLLMPDKYFLIRYLKAFPYLFIARFIQILLYKINKNFLRNYYIKKLKIKMI